MNGKNSELGNEKVNFFLESYAWTWKTLSLKRIDIKKNI